MNERLWLPSRNIFIFIIIYSFIFLLWINSLNFPQRYNVSLVHIYIYMFYGWKTKTQTEIQIRIAWNRQRQSASVCYVVVWSMVNKLVDVEIKWIFTAFRLYAYDEWLMEHILRFIDLYEKCVCVFLVGGGRDYIFIHVTKWNGDPKYESQILAILPFSFVYIYIDIYLCSIVVIVGWFVHP